MEKTARQEASIVASDTPSNNDRQLKSEAEPLKKKNTTDVFNQRTLWPDRVILPHNKWTFTRSQVVGKLAQDMEVMPDTKKVMEKCLMYFYLMKKSLALFDHTYTCACILFFRYWFIHGIPPNLVDAIHLSQALLITACKIEENNRSADTYVKSTFDYLLQIVPAMRGRTNIDKVKWEIRDRMVVEEKNVLCAFGFDFDVENPKDLIEDMFSGFYRYNRDYGFDQSFTDVFPKILIEVRAFLVQAVTQPVSLICDGYNFIALSLLYCGVQYKKLVDPNFRYPRNFFRDRFPITISAKKYESLFNDYRILEDQFFDLKSNKGIKLQISGLDIEAITDEDVWNVDETVFEPHVLLSHEEIEKGEVKAEYLEHLEKRVNDLIEKTIEMSEKKKNTSGSESNQSINIVQQ